MIGDSLTRSLIERAGDSAGFGDVNGLLGSSFREKSIEGEEDDEDKFACPECTCQHISQKFHVINPDRVALHRRDCECTGMEAERPASTMFENSQQATASFIRRPNGLLWSASQRCRTPYFVRPPASGWCIG